MNNEPVAWIYDWGDEQDIKTKLFPNSKAKITPLYTHPAKTLTKPSVKEITDLWLDVVNNIPANDKRPREWHFANAILRKAQEK